MRRLRVGDRARRSASRSSSTATRPRHGSPRWSPAAPRRSARKTRLTGEYWAAIAELLDLLVAGDLEIGTTAQRLGITTGALSKLLLHDDQVARAVNDLRRGRGMRPLR